MRRINMICGQIASGFAGWVRYKFGDLQVDPMEFRVVSVIPLPFFPAFRARSLS
jgi:hypothetical protein